MTICKLPGCTRYVLCDLMVIELDKHLKPVHPERTFVGYCYLDGKRAAGLIDPPENRTIVRRSRRKAA